MKKFAFPLGRVLDWRRTQASMEEMKLTQFHAELRDIETRIASARAEKSDSERSLLESGAVTGASLAALDSFKRSVAAECARLEDLAAKSRRRIAHQLEIIAAKRRDARLLEKLEQKKLAEWKAEFDRELERQADEAYSSRRHAVRSRSSPAGAQV
jgi:flagellar export protein FliJ